MAGWLLAAAAQPPGYDPVHQTISALAAHGAAHRWIMTAGLAGLGLVHVGTAAGLRGARVLTRAVLAAAGLATLGVAVFAEPARGSSPAHAGCAAVAFVLLALWPATSARRVAAGVSIPSWPERRSVAIAASAVSVVLLLWFAATLAGPSAGPIGVSERVLSAQQALWPLVVVVAARRRHAVRLDA